MVGDGAENWREHAEERPGGDDIRKGGDIHAQPAGRGRPSCAWC
jgi:hypothetical protein